ncbi:hypothetical protein B0H16DRAFT_1820588 [Mycena metata]|uniref:Uncharacterized protein n=1 Tax=Mycena metata TaxID=1033252 RepID=A0AAD7J9W5_9AGAR|nr:hypothetical protein B0H16DRAFT_1820588 [Mycena metata]
MSRNYPIRPSWPELNSDDFDNELDAVSTIGATSSPPGPQIPDIPMGGHIPYLDLQSDLLPDDDDNEPLDDLTYGSNSRAPKMTDTEKTVAVLEFMKDRFPRLSLRLFLTQLFTSDNPSITNITNTYLSMGRGAHLLETVIGDKAIGQEDRGHTIMKILQAEFLVSSGQARVNNIDCTSRNLH